MLILAILYLHKFIIAYLKNNPKKLTAISLFFDKALQKAKPIAALIKKYGQLDKFTTITIKQIKKF